MKRDLQFKKVLKINAGKALDIVSNFDKYAEFVPGCTGASLISRNPPIEIGLLEFQILGKKYFIKSRNEIFEDSINIKQLKGPFNNFNAKWSVRKIDKDRLQKSQDTLTDDIEREKNIILEATSNEKRLKEEKNELIEIDSKYYDTEKKSSFLVLI